MFYHDLAFSHGVSTDTVFRAIHRVTDVRVTLQGDVVKWPENCNDIAREFRDIAGFPAVAGCLDGTHVMVSPPKSDEEGFINRHHTHSINVVGVCGPNLRIYYINSSCPGRWHDSRVS